MGKQPEKNIEEDLTQASQNNGETQEKSRERVKGSSLWADAWRQLKRNKAALMGIVVVVIMTIFAASYELMCRYVTHFTSEEQHAFVVPKPPGARSVPSTYYSLIPPIQGASFQQIDENQDGVIDPNEITNFYRRYEFEALDTNADAFLDLDEYLAAPLSRPAPSDFVPDCAKWQVIQRSLAPIAEESIFDCIAGTDKRIDLKEAGKLVALVSSGEAFDILSKFDKNEDGLLEENEYVGFPRPVVNVLGTDQLGRDLLTRTIYGARISLAVGFLATIVSFLIGVTYGATAGFFGGVVDNIMMRIVDIFYGLPFMFLVILLMVVFGQNIMLLFLALGAIQWLTMARIVRGQVLSLKQREFVQAAKAMGVPNRSIIFRHLIPNALGPIIVYVTLTVPAVMLEEAFLSFLGLGIQAPQTSWGALISEGRQLMETAPWLIIVPSFALAITLLSLNFLGDGIRDALDPQMRK